MFTALFLVTTPSLAYTHARTHTHTSFFCLSLKMVFKMVGLGFRIDLVIQFFWVSPMYT